MFIPVGDPNGISRIVGSTLAIDDLRSFFDNRYGNGRFSQSLINARNEVTALDNATAVFPVGVCAFTGFCLDWLEERRITQLQPWIYRNGRQRLVGSSAILSFLRLLLEDIRCLIEPKLSGIRGYRQSGRTSGIFIEFVEFIISQNAYLLIPDCPPWWDWQSFRGYASWLVILPRSREAYIVNNEWLIDNSSKERESVFRRYENIFLHELGHFRTMLSHYETAVARSCIVEAEPAHEATAWLYAKLAKAAISGVRARLCRVVGSSDPEWQ